MYEGKHHQRRTASASAIEDGEEVEREIVRHHGRRRHRRPRRRATCSSCASRARRSATRTCWRSRPGKLDVEGEEPLEAAQRELAEEIGKAAERWEPLARFFTSPGFSDEEVHVFLATGLRDDAAPRPTSNERIDVVRWPLADLDGAIAATRDSKTLIALLWLSAPRR